MAQPDPHHHPDQFPRPEHIDDPNLAELSARELAELIEAEQEFVDEYELGLQQGAEALLREVEHRKEQLVNQRKLEITSHTEGGTFPEAEALFAQLNNYADELDDRARALAERETEVQMAADQVMEFQQQLVRQLDLLLNQIDQMEDNRDDGFTRSAA